MPPPPFVSRLDATVERARTYEEIHPPTIANPDAVDDYATLFPLPGVRADALIDRAPRVKILEVEHDPEGLKRAFFELKRPHPHLEGLRLWVDFDPRALTMLPGLKFVQIAGRAITPEMQAALPTGLEEMWVHRPDVEASPRFTNLKLLRANLPKGRASQTKALASMTSLRALHLECAEQLRGGKALGRLTELEQLSINSVADLGLEDLVGCKRLRSLGVGSLTSLEGVDALESLEGLGMAGRRCPPLAPLRGAQRLTHLSITSSAPPPDLEVIGDLRGLRSLVLSPGSVSSVFALPSAAMFAHLTNLEVLRCRMMLDDKDLRPLAGLARLNYLCFLGTFPEEAVKVLKQRLPKCEVDLTVGTPPPPRPEKRFGALTAEQDEDGRWSVFQDLTVTLNVDTNHDAQDAIEKEVRRTAKAVLARIEFDSESDAFCFYADTLDDVRAVSKAVDALVAKRKK